MIWFRYHIGSGSLAFCQCQASCQLLIYRLNIPLSHTFHVSVSLALELYKRPKCSQRNVRSPLHHYNQMLTTAARDLHFAGLVVAFGV